MTTDITISAKVRAFGNDHAIQISGKHCDRMNEWSDVKCLWEADDRTFTLDDLDSREESIIWRILKEEGRKIMEAAAEYRAQQRYEDAHR